MDWYNTLTTPETGPSKNPLLEMQFNHAIDTVRQENLNFKTAWNGGEISGKSGDDHLTGSWYHDVLDGGKGDDVLVSSLGNDTLIGGQGADTLRAGFGSHNCSPKIWHCGNVTNFYHR